MEYRLTTAWGMALLLAAATTASAQTGNSASDKDKDAPKSESKPANSDDKSKNKAQSSGETMTVKGEVAGVSVVGETMVDYSTGRGEMAEFTYLTILGSPSEMGKGGEKEEKTADQAKNNNKDKANDKDDEMGSSDRRRVYQIAVGPETQVCERDASKSAEKTSDQGDKDKSARDKSIAALEKMQLGDQVEIVFERGEHRNRNENSTASGNHTRHGRHRMIRGVAKSITILSSSSSDEKGHESKPESQDKK